MKYYLIYSFKGLLNEYTCVKIFKTKYEMKNYWDDIKENDLNGSYELLHYVKGEEIE